MGEPVQSYVLPSVDLSGKLPRCERLTTDSAGERRPRLLRRPRRA